MSEVVAPPVTAPVYPTVAFDIKLGKSVEYIDFDYDSYYEHLSSQGVSDEQIADSQIKVKPNNYINPVRGSVSAKTGELTVLAGPGLNKTFMHESQHLIDYHNSPPSSTEKAYIGAYTIGLFGVAPVLIGESLVSEYILHQPEAVPDTLWNVATGVATLSALAYYCSTSERRARKAAKVNDQQFFTLTKKS